MMRTSFQTLFHLIGGGLLGRCSGRNHRRLQQSCQPHTQAPHTVQFLLLRKQFLVSSQGNVIIKADLTNYK